MTKSDQKQKKTSISVSELEKVLLGEINLYEKYAALLESDTQYMMFLKIDELEESNKAKATLLLKIQNIEEARQRLVSQVANERGIKSENIKISDLCQNLSSQEAERLVTMRDRLLQVIVRIKDIQSDTAQFVQSSLTWIEGSMATLRRLLSPNSTYNNRGKVDQASTFAGRVVENKV